MRQQFRCLASTFGLALLATVSVCWAEIPTQADNIDPTQCESRPILLADATEQMKPADESDQPADDVRERAVPRMMPGQPGMAPPQQRQEFEQGVIEGSRIAVKPGYDIRVLPNGEGVIAKKKDDGLSTGIKCLCMGAKAAGRCKLVLQGNSSANCVSDGCKNGYCGVRIGPPSNSFMR